MSSVTEIRKAHRAVGALAVSIVVIAAVTIGLRATYGYFSNEMIVSGDFPRASQALRKGSDVKYLGVTVGKVHSIKLLPDHHVRIALSLSKGTKVPSNVKAVVTPNTFFGDKFVDLTVQGGRHGAPWLHDGSTLQETSPGDEVEQLIGDADQLLGGINTRDLTSLMTELTRFAQGEGAKIAENFEVGVKAASSFSDTINAQLTALDSLARFQAAIRGIGPDVNAIASDLNIALPVFNQARADFYKMLDTLRPFADNLASLIAVNRPSLDRIFVDGENVARVILAQHDEIGQVIYGTSRYLLKFGSGASADTLPDGSKFAYFKVVTPFPEIADMICGVIAPPQPNAPPGFTQFQQSLVQSLNGASHGRIDCSKYANPGGVQPSGSPAPAPSADAATPSPAPAPAPAPQSTPPPSYGDQVYGALGTPDHSTPSSLGSFLNTLVGGR